MKITELNITNCKSLKTFKGVDETEITRLIANGTTLRDLTSLVGSKVNDLRLRFSEIISLSGIEKMEVLTLDVRQCLKLKDISALEGSSIRDLTIRGTTPTDLTPINKMPHLRSTDIKP